MLALESSADELRALLACDPDLAITESPQFTDEPKFAVFQARRRDGTGFAGHGVDLDPLKARLKAVAEALERSCLQPPAAGELVTARFGDIPGQIDPAEFRGGEGAKELRETPRQWAEAIRVSDGGRVLLPAEAVYVGLTASTAAPIRRESISTGAALGLAGSEQAFLRGLFEVIERDAFMNAWSGGRAPEPVGGPIADLEPLFETLRRYRLESRLFDLGRELGPPAVLVVTIDRSGGGPAVTAGTAAAANYRDAMRSAILESVGVRRGIRFKMSRGTWPQAGPRERIDSIEARAAFWTPLSSLELLPDWVFSTEKRPPSQRALPCTVDRALSRLAQRGLEVYRCELTSPALAEKGFEVVRVVVPRLWPLHIAESAAVSGCRRGATPADPHVPPHPFV